MTRPQYSVQDHWRGPVAQSLWIPTFEGITKNVYACGLAEGEIAYFTTTFPTLKCSSASSLTSMPKPGASGTVMYPPV